jgi:hypothetical protein
MTIYKVFSVQYDAERNVYEQLEGVFATEQLAKDFMHYTIGKYIMQESKVITEDSNFVKFVKKAESEGRVTIVND